jgi:hypothetical protein
LIFKVYFLFSFISQTDLVPIDIVLVRLIVFIGHSTNRATAHTADLVQPFQRRKPMYSQKELQEKIVKLKEIITSHEMIRYHFYRELAELEHMVMDEIGPPPGRLPVCHIYQYDDLKFDLLQISYEGMLPLYDKDQKYKNTVRDYYLQATIQAFQREKINIQFSKAVVFICHYFQDGKIRDLDNRNRKVVIDAVRKIGIIEDDNWLKVMLMESGLHDPDKNHMEVYIFRQENLTDFLIWFG